MTPQNPPNDEVRGLIGWFATNHVAANLMMMAIIIGGVFAVVILKKETMPEFNTDEIQINVPYLGAAPEEVETGVVLRIEEAIETIEGIHEIESDSFEGGGTVSVELEEGVAIGDMMDKLKLAVDGISTFPVETERPRLSERIWRNPVVNVQLAGDLDEATMKELIDTIREEIIALPGVSYAQEMGSRPFEIAIEVSESVLREYGLTLQSVSNAIRQWSLDMPGGSIRSAAGDIRLRATGQAYTGQEFEDIVLLTRPDGTRLRLRDIATIRDGFAEVESYSFFNGRRSFGISVMATKEENPLDISAAVRAYVEERNLTLPPETQLTVWMDTSTFLEGRLDMMLKNMALGAMLVLVILGVFLHLKIAGWVILGMAVAFLGAFAVMPVTDVTINMMSLFAFILVLGIVVDDAIIIGESAYAETEQHGYTLPNIVRGAQKVAVPATFGVLTTVMAFLPMLFQSGRTSAFAAAIAWVVILCLVFSLVESKLILPSHLAIMRSSHGKKRGVSDWAGDKLKRFIEQKYRPFLERAIEYRWTTLAAFVGIMLLIGGMLAGGWVRWVYFPEFEADFLSAQVELQEGAPESLIADIVRQMEASLREVDAELQAEFGLEDNAVEHVFTFIQNGQSGQFNVALAEGERREISPRLIEQRWREKVGEIAGARQLRFGGGMRMSSGPPISFDISGRDHGQLEAAADWLVEHLRTYDGLFEIESSSTAGPEEIKLTIKPEAEALGVTLADLAGQVRQAFYGAEAQRIQRGNSEVRVMVRYPRSERRSIGNLESMWIRLPDGRELPFGAVAEYELQRGYSSIRRENGRRTITVSSNADLNAIEPGAIMGEVYRTAIPQLMALYPDVRFDAGVSAREQQSSIVEMLYGFGVALLGIYVLMAVPLKSYLQPLVIMTVIPFGLIGAVLGHWICGITMNAISLLGFFALTGVVVNDSLILVHYINRRVSEGAAPLQAALDAGTRRFRPILLTSLTTFFGLVPIVLERSMHAQMVIPMAVSLAFGILFATTITLILIPCLYMSSANLRARFTRREPALPAASAATARGSALR